MLNGAVITFQGKNNFKTYLNNLDASGMTGNWTPAGKWHKLHGDTKSSTGGRFRMFLMTTSDGKYKVKLTDEGSQIWGNEYNSEPSFATIVSDVTSAF